MKSETFTYIVLGVGAYLLVNSLSNNRLSKATGETIGNTAASIPVGFIQGIWDVGYKIGYNSYFLSPNYFRDIWSGTYGKLFK